MASSSSTITKLLRVPEGTDAAAATAPRKEGFIGVIDSSGSMRPWWAWVAQHYNQYRPKEVPTVTITFDTTPHLCATNLLSDSLSVHGGKTTNISAAFVEMEMEIAKFDKDTHL